MMRTNQLHRRRLLAGCLLLVQIGLFAAAAPWLSPHAPDTQNPSEATRLQAPSASHPCGTDQFGRDLFSRILHGGRISLSIGLLTMLIAVAIGTLYGALSGYLGGLLDVAMMRIVDLFLAFPLIFLVATCLTLFGNKPIWLIGILSLTAWPDIARLVRAEVLSLKNRAFVRRAHASGLPRWRVLLRHLLPNVMTTVAAVAVLRMVDIILVESAMSFLGLGVQPPTATWGAILSDGRTYLATAWWIAFFPGLAIVLSTVGLHLLGEGLQRVR